MGDLVIFYLKETVQQFDYTLKKPIDTVLHEDPRANFFALGAHFAHKIDNLISIFTNIFSHLLLPVFLKIKALLS